MLKLWWKRLWCKHEWRHDYNNYGIMRICKKCGKTKWL